MPSGGGSVYQPTTVSYEPNRTDPYGGGGQVSSMGVDSPLRVFRKPRPQVALLIFALISLAAGVAMLASATADLLETEDLDEEATTDNVTSCIEPPLGVILGGIFMTCLSFVSMGIYLKVADWRRNCLCPCPLNKKSSFPRQLQDNNCGHESGVMALNPSTDPLVSHTQYAPVSELLPSLHTADEEERRNLMPDNKDCLSSAEESDRMLDPDPRILLRPMGRVEDA